MNNFQLNRTKQDGLPSILLPRELKKKFLKEPDKLDPFITQNPDCLNYYPGAPATTDAPATTAEALVTEVSATVNEEISDGALAGKDLLPVSKANSRLVRQHTVWFAVYMQEIILIIHNIYFWPSGAIIGVILGIFLLVTIIYVVMKARRKKKGET